MREKGVVEEVFGKTAVVSVMRTSACGESCKNCSGACRFSKNKVTALNAIGAKCKDVVLIEADSKKVLKSAFLVYILPLIVFFCGYFAVKLFVVNEALCVIAALILFCGVFTLLHNRDKKHKLKTEIKICEIVRDNN